MRTLQLILTASIMFIPSICLAEDTCLWMNAATAGGILGGAVTGTVSRPNVVKSAAETSSRVTANAKSSAGPMSADPSGTSYLKLGTDDSDCAFVLQSGLLAAELRIQVRTMGNVKKDFVSYSASCGTKAAPLKAIGNEAYACMLHAKSGQVVEQIIGRVRDRVFVVRLSSKDPSAGSTIGEQLRKAANIIAGNLF